MLRLLRLLFTLLTLVCFITPVLATHNRAGEITYRQIGELTYEATVITYTDSRSTAADRSEIDLDWGDNTSSTGIQRQSKTYLGENINKNVYVAQHTYSGQGVYHIRFFDPNRVEGIANITNSVTVPFFIESLLIINARRGFNQSPVLLQPPIDFACAGHIFIHYPNAYDPDGDSLSFSLIPPKSDVNNDVPGYFVPAAKNAFSLNPYTGEVKWDYPEKTGIYNIAIRIDEYRNKQVVGYVIRDMQIIVDACDNRPPVIEALIDTCVEAGKNFTLTFTVTATDPDPKDSVRLSASGGPFLQLVSKALFTPENPQGFRTVSGTFSWNIACEHIRKEPYRVVFRAVDNNRLLPLSDLKHIDIKVVGPAPKNLLSKAIANSIILNWQKPTCNSAKAYLIYRKSYPSGWTPGYCETGVPAYTGFRLIDTITDINVLTYTDDDQGIGLSPGVTYCYRITAVYLNQGQFQLVEGYASNETCAELKKDIPVPTHVSVLTTSSSSGKIYVEWSKPTQLDTNQTPGPYLCKVFRAEGLAGGTYSLIRSFTSSSFSGMKDTFLTDSNLNTSGTPYNYRFEFYYTFNGSQLLMGRSISASSIFLKARRAHYKIQLSWDVTVPWRNRFFTVYRRNSSGGWDSIGYSITHSYTDSGLSLGQTYCYKVLGNGSYYSPNFTDPLLNYSQEICSSPRDTIPPCPPPLFSALANCDQRVNALEWQLFESDTCWNDVVSYNIYYTPDTTDNFRKVGTVSGRKIFSYTDQRDTLRKNLAGCYVITTVDSLGNESRYSEKVCVDNCPVYKLPNVFTPNGDDANDVFRPLPESRFVKSIELYIYNRWGQQVFHTTDPDIGWNGTDQQSGKPLAEGVYFYICTVNQLYLKGINTYTVSGAIHLFR